MLPRWLDLCQRLTSRDNLALYQSLFTRLATTYQTPPRAYHSLSHIADCLQVLDSSHTPREHPDVLEWSLWLHDCVYGPTRKDNEAASAQVSASMLSELGQPDASQSLTTSLILATRHTGEPLAGDHALLADIDMSILASSADKYAAYADAIREEYSFVPKPDYRTGRGAFLAGLLARRVSTTRRSFLMVVKPRRGSTFGLRLFNWLAMLSRVCYRWLFISLHQRSRFVPTACAVGSISANTCN